MVDNIETSTVGAGKTMLSVIDFLHSRDGAQLSDIADELDVAMSTAHRHVKTLEERDYLVSDGRQIRLSTEFLRLGNGVRYRTELADVSEPLIEELAIETEERANLFVEELGYSVCIHRKLGNRGVIADTEMGKRFPMHATAAGKAILSQLSENRVRAIVREHGLPACTDNTITDEERLFEELEAIRDRDIAYNDEEYIENLRAIGVPVFNEGEPPAALTISGPTHRLSDDRLDRELTDDLLGTANELKLKLEY